MTIEIKQQYTLNHLRKLYKYKATWLAKQLGISRQQYYKYEQKEAVIYPDTKAKLAQIYNIPVDRIKF